MKIKTDFVTNSSSSSFVVIGTHLSEENIDIELFQNIKSKRTVTMEQLMEDPYEYLDPVLKGSDLEWSQGCEYGEGEIMVGIGYTAMRDEETLGQFKQRVKDQIKEKLGADVTPGHIEECWMDG